MEIQSLYNRQDKLNEYINVIETEFNYTNPYSYKVDFAPLFNQSNLQNCLFLEEENKIIATAAFVIKDMIYKNALIKVCMIGAMATRNEFQGKGHFKKLFTHIIDINQDKVGLFFLWSDQHSLYEKYEFYPSGKTVELGSNEFNEPENYKKAEFRNLSSKELNEIKILYSKNIEQKYFTIQRNSNWEDVIKVTSAHLYIKKNKQNEIIAYFLCHKGFDLSNIIHEFAGNNLSEELSYLKKFKLWLPENFKNYNSTLHLNLTALVRIGNIKIIETFIKQYSKRSISLNSQNEEIVYELDEIKESCSKKDFLNNWLELSENSKLKEIQISPYISGIDSI